MRARVYPSRARPPAPGASGARRICLVHTALPVIFAPTLGKRRSWRSSRRQSSLCSRCSSRICSAGQCSTLESRFMSSKEEAPLPWARRGRSWFVVGRVVVQLGNEQLFCHQTLSFARSAAHGVGTVPKAFPRTNAHSNPFQLLGKCTSRIATSFTHAAASP